MPPDLKARLRRGEPLGVLFDANSLLDVFLQRENAVPAARVLTFAEAGAFSGDCSGEPGPKGPPDLDEEGNSASVK